uniref:Zinc finger protein n=1 Tax=Ascaris lumbricoides TaxID=6252 RepID=A0A0M3HUP7_ASCLU
MEESERCRKKERRKVEKRHKCPNCEAAFAFRNKLRLHINSHHSLSHVCDRCEARFDRFVQLRTHMAFAHKTKHQCHLCAYSSSVKAELRKHIVANHENGVTCTIDGCNITIAYNRLKRHIREVHCSDTKKKSTIADGHSTEGLSNGGTPTDDCSSIASTHEDIGECSNMVQHNDSPVETPLIEPPDLANCDQSSAAATCEPHGDGGTNPSDETEKESTCSTAISDQAPSCVATCSHYSDSRSVGSFGSSRGEEDFSDGDDFTMEAEADELEVQEYPADEAIRQGEFMCAVCRKRFRTLRNEKRHYRRVHDRTYKKPDRERKYRCDEQGCGRAFYLPAKLREHRAFHKGENVISCNNCEKYFKSRALYAVHLRRYHQLSIRDVNCSPRFISVLKVEASEPFQLINESSTSDKLPDDIAVSSTSDPIANECVRDVMASDSHMFLNGRKSDAVSSESSVASTGEMPSVSSGHFVNTDSECSKGSGGADVCCSSSGSGTASGVAVLSSVFIDNRSGVDASFAGSEGNVPVAAALGGSAIDSASASIMVSRKADGSCGSNSEANVIASVEDQRRTCERAALASSNAVSLSLV